MPGHIIYHHPLPIEEQGASGSRVRVRAMLRAFIGLGYEVHGVTGYSAQRRRAMKRILRLLREGTRFEFCYAENSTTPTLLTDPHHLPLSPWLDASFFKRLRHAGIPVGMYIRDVHWAFDLYPAGFPAWKKSVLAYFQRHDLRIYRRHANQLFLPSMEMAPYIPGGTGTVPVAALPPGCALPDVPQEPPSDPNHLLHLAYVGGITPPLYDLTGLLAALRGLECVRLTLVCRKPEWEAMKGQYGSFNPRQVEVVHASGERLGKLLRKADVFAMTLGEHTYHEFAFPVKIMEAVGHGLPLACLGDTLGARFVEQYGLGWRCETVEGLRELLTRLHTDRRLLAQKRGEVLAARESHTWEARARQAADTLLALRQG
jgi:hypothetical protein